MDLAEPILARAVSDALDTFVEADEPLAGLQHSCGGEIPGPIAIPELLELVRRARRYGFRLARAIHAQDGSENITAWVEVDPCIADGGCEIILRSWQSASVVPDDAATVLSRRTLLDREMAELSALLDADQRLVMVTQALGELQSLGTEMTAGIGQPFTDFLAPQIHSAAVLHWRMLDGAPVAIEGSQRPWRIVLVPQGRPGADPSGFELLLVSDEPPPAASVQDAAAPQVSPGHGLVGHDLAPVLRQPIARIVANAETIRSRLAGPLPDAYADYAGEIANAGRLLLGLLEDLSDLEVVESESFDTAPDRIDLAEVARQASGILSVRAQEKGITVIVPAQDARLGAIAEFRRVLQVLINLIGNAIRYSPEESTIEVRLERDEHRVRVIVADQGPGLSAEQQGIVFEKFERLGRSGDGGSGLGLYISRRLARAMGGELSVDSTIGEGARFILEVPADLAADKS